MRLRLTTLPLIVLLMGIGAAAMLLPALHAYVTRDLPVARVFLYSSILFGTIFAFLAIALAEHRTSHPARSQLVGLTLAMLALPVMLAVPLDQSMPGIPFFHAWFEMVSSITTTGATLFDAPGSLPDSIHLWRALVGWLGGLMMWIAAAAILAPLSLGGFEVVSPPQVEAGQATAVISRPVEPRKRLARYAGQLAPVYGGLTLILWMLLQAAGLSPLDAICRAMSTMATSGIVTGGAVPTGFAAELAIFAFLVFAISRRTFGGGGLGTVGSAGTREAKRGRRFRNHGAPRFGPRLRDDPELRLGLFLIAMVPAFLFLRHWLGALEGREEDDLWAAGRALWGAIYTTASFLTTTGFESAWFAAARDWSDLQTPGLVLMGLSLVGGGVATTAGGVKLMRIHALRVHGLREMDKLVHPSSVGGSGSTARRIRRQGAYVAWVFFMLFAMSIALVMGLLTLTGLDFTEATVLTLAALTTTGPLAAVGGEAPILYVSLGTEAKAILALAMALGRLETLALIALVNPDFWRA